MKPESSFRPVPSVDRTLDLLELLSRHKEGLSFNEILVQLDIPKSSLSGLMRTLTARHYVTRTPDKRRFRLGMKVLGLDRGYIQDGDLLDTAKQMLPRLVEEFGETAHVAGLDGGDAIHMASQPRQDSMSVNSPLGTRVPAHATAVGKSLLALLPDEEIDGRFPRLLEKRTSRTITSRVELKRELQQVRALGYAYDAEELAVGLTGIAAPIFDAEGQAIASIGVSIPTARLKEMDTVRVPFIVRSVAQEISQVEHTPTAGWRPRRVKVAWSMATLQVEAYQIVHRTAEQVCAESSGIDVIWTDAHEDATKQLVDVASLLELKPDVIIIHPVHALFADRLFHMAAQAGVPAVNFQRPVRSRYVDCFIGGDTFKQGQMTAHAVAQVLQGHGQCAMIEGDPYNDNARNFAKGVREELAAYPALRLVADEPSLLWSVEKASELADVFLAA